MKRCSTARVANKWLKVGKCSLLAIFLLAGTLPSNAQASPTGGREGATNTQHPSANTQATILFTGDILLDRGVRQRIEHGGFHVLFNDEKLRETLKNTDFIVGNLECPATKIKSPVFKRFIFRAEPEWLDSLKSYGFTHLNLANNHSIDQGREALIDTKNQVQRAGMTPIGAGLNMQEASQPVLLTSSPRHVWLVVSQRLPLENFAYLPEKPCVSQEPFDSLVSRVSLLRHADPQACIVVSLHWGQEHVLKPSTNQIRDAHRLIDAGANTLICHHPHTLQTIEHYKGATIYYSIGNFIFDLQRPLNARACMVQLTINADSIETKTIPILIERCAPTIAEP